MFAKIVVDYYGAPTPVHAAGVVPDARGRAWSSSSRTTSRSMAAIEKAIRDTDLGVNPTNDGNDHPGRRSRS